MADTVLERKTFQAGDNIFREGQEGNSAYIVQTGRVDIVKIVDGKEVILGSIGDGGIFGEMALIDDHPRMATARAAAGGTLIVVSRLMFQDKLKKADPFIRGLLKIFTDHIRTMAERPQ